MKQIQLSLKAFQHFTDTNRKVTLTVATDGSLSIGDRIGEYRLKEDKASWIRNAIVIEHISKQHREFYGDDDL